MDHPLRAPLEIEFDYTRSLGPVLSEFMTALAGRRILGARGADGRVHAPPFEYDPVSAEPPGELTEVGPEGTVVSWSWMPEPLEGQPLTGPFAWALIRLDGADTAMLHAVDAGSADGTAGPGPVGREPARQHPRPGLLRAVRWSERGPGDERGADGVRAAGADGVGAAGVDGVDVAELHAPFTHQELLLREALRLGDGVEVNPSGGALCGNPMFAAGLARIEMAARAVMSGWAGRALGHATSGPALQQNLVCVMEAR